MSDSVYIHGTAPEEQRRLAALNDITNEPFLRFLGLASEKAVLDVGCGLGILTRRLAQLHPDIEFWGIDASAEQLAQARADLPKLHFRHGDASALPFDADRFDVAFCRYLLEHVSDPVAVLQEMRRVLRPGGRALVQENYVLACTFDPDCPHFDALWRRFVQLQDQLGGDALVGKKLLRLFQKAGFQQVQLSIQPEVHYQGMPTFRVWIENLIGNVRSCEKNLLERGLASVEEIRRGVDDLRRLLDEEAGSAFFYWNRASGLK